MSGRRRSRRRDVLSAVVGLVALLSSLGVSLAGAGLAYAQEGSFTPEESRALRAGGLVIRREERQRSGHHYMGGTSFQVVDLPPEMVWRAMLDTPSYRHFLPQVSSTRVVERAHNHRLLQIVHRQGPVTADYFVNITFLPRRHIGQLRVDPTHPGAIRDGWGFFNVQPYGHDRTMVTWGIMADVGDGVVAGLLRARVHDWMLRVPAELKRYIEGWGRSRYETGTRN